MKKFITVNDTTMDRPIRVNIDKIVMYWAHGKGAILDIDESKHGLCVRESVEEINDMIDEATIITEDEE